MSSESSEKTTASASKAMRMVSVPGVKFVGGA